MISTQNEINYNQNYNPQDLRILTEKADSSEFGRDFLVSGDLEAVAISVAEISGIAYHKRFRVCPQSLCVVRCREPVLVLPGVGASETNTTCRVLGTCNVVYEIDIMTCKTGYRPIGILPVSIPS